MSDTEPHPPLFLDISYITPRIIAMSDHYINPHTLRHNNTASVARYLDKVHADHYLVFNLRVKLTYDVATFHNRVVRILLNDNQAPPLTAIQTFCDLADQWLLSDPRNVIVVHCHAGRGRTGTLICCYLLYKRYFNDPEEAIAFFSLKRVKNRKPKRQPMNQSQQRYVHYFDQLLKRPVLNRLQSLRLCAIELESKKQGFLASINPLFFTVNCRDLNSVFTSATYDSPAHSFTQVMEMKELPRVSGDIKITFFSKKLVGKREIFSFWFNTLFVGGPSFSPPGGARPSQSAQLLCDDSKSSVTGNRDQEVRDQLQRHGQSVSINGRPPAGPYRTLTLSGDELDSFSYFHSSIFTDHFQVRVYLTEDRRSTFSPSPYKDLGSPYKLPHSLLQSPRY